MRRAGLWAGLAFERARQGLDATAAGQRAVQELAAVDKTALTDDDQADAQEAALRVGASRWAVRHAPAPLPTLLARSDAASQVTSKVTTQVATQVTTPTAPQSKPSAKPATTTQTGRLRVSTRPGEPGQTCVDLHFENSTTPLVQRCTYGVVWAASAQASPSGEALALAVQPLQTWRELWLFQRSEQGWRVDVLPPASTEPEPELGYLEFSGWVPGTKKLLLTREAREGARYRRSFEVMVTDTLETDKRASDPGLLVLFGKWQDPSWKRESVALR
jgi:hypothetical protein